MTTRVRMLPSGREFTSQGNSTLLEAGLRSGLRLGYGCSNGNCGECVARVVTGDVRKVRHHDFLISGEDEAGGHILMCCNTAVTDVMLEAGEASSANEVPHQQIMAKVKNVSIVGKDVALLHLRTPRTNRLRFLAGQHVQLSVAGTPAADHPVGSCPCDDMHLHFQVPREAGKGFSDHVFQSLKTGDCVEVNGPEGDFILDEDSPRSLIFIALGTGFAPIRSLVEHAMSLEVADTIHLVWAAKDQQGRYFDNLCRSWADALDNFHYVPVDVDPGSSVPETGQKIAWQLDIDPDAMADHDCYIAGNEAFINACETAMISGGLPPEQLFTDCLAPAS